MDPCTKTSLELSAWCRKMGFLLPDDEVPSAAYFLPATLTANRRRLFKVIMEKIQDRRFVLKVRQYLKEDSARRGCKNLVFMEEDLRKNIADVEQRTQDCLERISSRGKAVKLADEAIADINSKILLFQLHKNRLEAEEKKYKEMGKELNNLLSIEELKTASDGMEQLKKVELEVAENWRDPCLKNRVDLLFDNNCFSSELLWNTLINNRDNRVNLFDDASSSACDSLRNFESSLPNANDCLEKTLAAVRECCLLTEAAILLVKGKVLAENAEEFCDIPNDLFCCDYIVQDQLKTISGISLPVCDNIADEPTALRLYYAEKKKNHEDLTKTVQELSEKLSQKQQEIIEMEQYILNSSVELSKFLGERETIWREMLRAHSQLYREYTDLITRWSTPIDSLRATPKKQDLDSGTLFQDKRKEFVRIAQERIDELNRQNDEEKIVLSPDRWGDDSSDPTDWENHTITDLKRTLDKTTALSKAAASAERIFQLYENQPFGDMIPSSYTVDGLTFPDYKIQRNLGAKVNNSRNLYRSDM